MRKKGFEIASDPGDDSFNSLRAKLPSRWRKLLLSGAFVASWGIILGAGILHVGAGIPDESDTPDAHPRYHALMDAIERNDLAAVKSQIKSGTDPNDFPPRNIDEDDIAPLCAAVSDKHLAMVRLLLDYGARVEVTDGWNNTPLGIARADGDVPMMKLLLSRGTKRKKVLDLITFR